MCWLMDRPERPKLLGLRSPATASAKFNGETRAKGERAMAWIHTDWDKELDQVEQRITEVLDEKVEPLLDRTVAKASTEMSTAVSRASYEIQDTAEHIFAEFREQRKEMVQDMKGVIRYAAMAAFVVIIAAGLVITLLGKYLAA